MKNTEGIGIAKGASSPRRDKKDEYSSTKEHRYSDSATAVLCERYYQILRDKKKNCEFMVINTHFDDIGSNARLKSAELIKKWIIKNVRDFPVILTGDLNVMDNSEVYSLFSEDTAPLVDTYKACKKPKGVNYSFHAFGRIPMSRRTKIDYIFVSNNSKVKSFDIPMEESQNGFYLSDHNPLIAYIHLKKNSKKLF